MSEGLHEIAVRMSGNRCGNGCDDCPANVLRHGGNACLIRRFAQIDNVDEQLDALKRWAEEHPRKTWLSMFNDAFPNALKKDDGTPRMCPDMLYGSAAMNDACENAHYHVSCSDCWKREVREE